MARRKKGQRRARSPHPGVKLRKRAGKRGVTWFARFRDPDKPHAKWPDDVNLNRLGLTTHEARVDWAKKKSKSLSKRRAEIASGAPLRTETDLKSAAMDYIILCKRTLRPNTVAAYQHGVDKFLAWAKGRVHYVEDLTGPKLVAFKEALVTGHRLESKPGGKRGQRKSGSTKLSPASINSYLGSVKILMNRWRRLGLCPRLDRDTIGDVLSAVKTPKRALNFLATDDLQALLEAAISHDQEAFKITRAEHAGKGKVGSTPRYDPIAPFVLFMVTTGCRVGEALSLSWEAVDLMAPDNNNQAVGEIHLSAKQTKTNSARKIDLAVSPGLRDLLSALKEAARGEKVFGWSRTKVDSARKRLVKGYGAPTFSWQTLRRTTGSFLTCSPGIFDAASVYRSAKQLGHSVEVAQRHYLGVVRHIPREAQTLDEAMGIEELINKIIKMMRTRSSSVASVRRKRA